MRRIAAIIGVSLHRKFADLGLRDQCICHCLQHREALFQDDILVVVKEHGTQDDNLTALDDHQARAAIFLWIWIRRAWLVWARVDLINDAIAVAVGQGAARLGRVGMYAGRHFYALILRVIHAIIVGVLVRAAEPRRIWVCSLCLRRALILRVENFVAIAVLVRAAEALGIWVLTLRKLGTEVLRIQYTIAVAIQNRTPKASRIGTVTFGLIRTQILLIQYAVVVAVWRRAAVGLWIGGGNARLGGTGVGLVWHSIAVMICGATRGHGHRCVRDTQQCAGIRGSWFAQHSQATGNTYLHKACDVVVRAQQDLQAGDDLSVRSDGKFLESSGQGMVAERC